MICVVIIGALAKWSRGKKRSGREGAKLRVETIEVSSLALSGGGGVYGNGDGDVGIGAAWQQPVSNVGISQIIATSACAIRRRVNPPAKRRRPVNGACRAGFNQRRGLGSVFMPWRAMSE
jgi:hypothetical protein